jgi:hypothetical protein
MGQENFFALGQRDNRTSRPGFSRNFLWKRQFKQENELQKTKLVSILLPRASVNCPNAKTRKNTYMINIGDNPMFISLEAR